MSPTSGVMAAGFGVRPGENLSVTATGISPWSVRFVVMDCLIPDPESYGADTPT